MIHFFLPSVQSFLALREGVSMYPGAIAFTLTKGASARAYDFVIPMTPYLAAAYIGDRGLPVTITFDATFTIVPLRCSSSILFPNSCVQKSVPLTSSESVPSTTSGESSLQDICVAAVSPALFTRTSHRPHFFQTFSARTLTCRKSLRSAWSAKESTPAFLTSLTISVALSADFR